MIVISDTSPLNYLILIECIDVLPQLYGRVVIPEGVLAEGGSNYRRDFQAAGRRC